ncbi:MAG: sulfite exporter TauE/SafE family protein [bacterium]|nr:MAG: sulfite exporter TauE/SafE family protein [bacterium]
MLEFALILLAGILAGTLGGMLGIGGGIIIFPVLRFGLGLPPALAAGTCIVAVFFTTLGGSYRHYKLGHINIRSILPLIIAGAVSTVIFSLGFLYLTSRERWIDLGVGMVFAFISARMILEGLPWQRKEKLRDIYTDAIHGSWWKKVILGGAAGILPGLMGIGTGAILVPAFTFLFNTSVKVAMGSSLACFAANAFCSSLLKVSQDYVVLETAVPICLGTLIGSNIGARLNKQFPSTALKLIFGIVFTYVSLKFILSYFGVTV